MTSGKLLAHIILRMGLGKKEVSYTMDQFFAQKKSAFEFDGEKYKIASRHQKEWGNKIIAM